MRADGSQSGFGSRAGALRQRLCEATFAECRPRVKQLRHFRPGAAPRRHNTSFKARRARGTKSALQDSLFPGSLALRMRKSLEFSTFWMETVIAKSVSTELPEFYRNLTTKC